MVRREGGIASPWEKKKRSSCGKGGFWEEKGPISDGNNSTRGGLNQTGEVRKADVRVN